MIHYRLSDIQELREREQEFRQLTNPDVLSDMNRTLTDARRGRDLLVVVIVAEEEGALLGWVVIDNFKRYVCINVFVDSEHRRKGIGTELVQRALTWFEVAGDPSTQILNDGTPESFWEKFPRVHTGSV